jgi:hypothetical protein
MSLPASAQMLMPMQNMPTGIDCGTPENALEYYCNHRDQFDKSGQFTGPPVAAVTTPSGPDVSATGSTRAHRTAHPARHH